MTLTAAKLRQLVDAAFILGQEGRLVDPTDSDVLIYAAEHSGDTVTDLSRLDPAERQTIVDAYDRGTGL